MATTSPSENAFLSRSVSAPVNGIGLRRAVLFNDLSCFGKCSITVGLPILSAAGVEALPLPTALLSTHTGGFRDYTCLELTGEVRRILNHWRTLQLHLDGLATGYFCSPTQIALASALLDELAAEDALTLVDPVMADGGALYPGFDSSFVEAMRTLCGRAQVITPNLTEAQLLAGLPCSEEPDAARLRQCLEGLRALGAKNCIITGVPYTHGMEVFDACHVQSAPGGREIGCLCMDEQGSCFAVWHPYVSTALHGCGDVFSAAFLGAALGCGPQGLQSLPLGAGGFRRAVQQAVRFTSRCVQATDAGQYPGHWYGLRFEPCLAEGFWSEAEHGC